MRIPARAAGPLIALTIAAASFGCVAPAAYAEDATATVASDGGNHIVVDINLHDDADGSGSGSEADSPSTDEGDSKAAGEAEEAKKDESKGKREKTWGGHSRTATVGGIRFCRDGGHYRRDYRSSCRRHHAFASLRQHRVHGRVLPR